MILVGAMGAYFVATSLIVVAPPRRCAPFDLACCIGSGLLVGALADRRHASRVQTSDHASESSLDSV